MATVSSTATPPPRPSPMIAAVARSPSPAGSMRLKLLLRMAWAGVPRPVAALACLLASRTPFHCHPRKVPCPRGPARWSPPQFWTITAHPSAALASISSWPVLVRSAPRQPPPTAAAHVWSPSPVGPAFRRSAPAAATACRPPAPLMLSITVP